MTHLSELVERAAGGEEIVIGKHGRPLVRMVAHSAPIGPPRKPGAWRGRVRIRGDFDELPAEVASAFLGERP